MKEEKVQHLQLSGLKSQLRAWKGGMGRSCRQGRLTTGNPGRSGHYFLAAGLILAKIQISLAPLISRPPTAVGIASDWLPRPPILFVPLFNPACWISGSYHRCYRRSRTPLMAYRRSLVRHHSIQACLRTWCISYPHYRSGESYYFYQDDHKTLDSRLACTQ